MAEVVRSALRLQSDRILMLGLLKVWDTRVSGRNCDSHSADGAVPTQMRHFISVPTTIPIRGSFDERIKKVEKKDLVLQLPQVVRNLSNAQQALVRHYSNTGLRFTLDGRLVGDIAEALALEYFDLVPPQRRTGGVDALTKTGKKTVQVKATGKEKSGPAFTPGEGFADYLLFFRIDFEANTASVAYNGPEAPVRALLPKGNWAGTKVIALADILELARQVANEEALQPKAGV